MKLSNVLYVFIICIGFNGVIQAQEAEAPQDRRQMQMSKELQMMQDSLSLSDSQVLKISEAQEKAMKQFQTIRANTTDREEAKQQGRAVRKQLSADIQSFLTEEQFAEWQRIKKSRAKMPRGSKRPSGEKQ